MKKALLSAAAIAVVFTGSQSAGARPLAEHFGAMNSCYERTYSASHMRKHPNQRVIYMRIEHFPTMFGTHNDDGTISFNERTGVVYFGINVRFRGSRKVYTNGGECRPKGRLLHCQIECDGGSFQLKNRSSNSILLINKRGFAVSGCGEEEYREVSHKTDDKIFRLNRVSDANCKPPAKSAE